MLSPLKKSLKTVVTLSIFALAAQANAADFLPLAKDLQPNVKGLPSAFVKPLKVSICLFDMQGINGEIHSRAKDLALIARRWNIVADFKVSSDEEKTAENFKSGKCEAAVLPTLRAREFNKFMGSVDAIGGLPTYEHLRVLLGSLFDSRLDKKTISEPYQIVSVFPMGAQYIHVKDRSLESIHQLKDKKTTVLSWGNSLDLAGNALGLKTTTVAIGELTKSFKDAESDVLISPAVLYGAFELKKGLGENGGIYKTPVVQTTVSLVINRDLLKKKTPDLDSRVTAFKEIMAKFQDDMLERMFKTINTYEKDVPKKYWMILEPEHEKAYQEALRQTRIQLTKDGVYDVTMMKVLKKVRCKIDASASECSSNDE